MLKPLLFYILIFSNCQGQENGFDNPEFNKNFNESKAKTNLSKELGNDWNTGGLDVHFGLTDLVNHLDSIEKAGGYNDSMIDPVFGLIHFPVGRIKDLGYNDNQAIEFDTIPYNYGKSTLEYNYSDEEMEMIRHDTFERPTRIPRIIEISLTPFEDPNLIRDNCGQWWERNIEYGEWEQGKRDKPEFTIYKMEYWESHNLRNCCNYISECKPEYECELTEYRFDPSNKIEYSRTVKVTYKKIEL